MPLTRLQTRPIEPNLSVDLQKAAGESTETTFPQFAQFPLEIRLLYVDLGPCVTLCKQFPADLIVLPEIAVIGPRIFHIRERLPRCYFEALHEELHHARIIPRTYFSFALHTIYIDLESANSSFTIDSNVIARLLPSICPDELTQVRKLAIHEEVLFTPDSKKICAKSSICSNTSERWFWWYRMHRNFIKGEEETASMKPLNLSFWTRSIFLGDHMCSGTQSCIYTIRTMNCQSRKNSSKC